MKIRRLTYRNGHDAWDVAPDDPALDRGWWAIEWDDGLPCRWSMGDAVLPFPGAGMLEVTLAGTMRYQIEEAAPAGGLVLAAAAAAQSVGSRNERRGEVWS